MRVCGSSNSRIQYTRNCTEIKKNRTFAGHKQFFRLLIVFEYRCSGVCVYAYICTVLVDISPATGTETYSPTTMISRCRPATPPSSSACSWRSVVAGCAPG